MLQSFTFKAEKPNYCLKSAISGQGISITPEKYPNNTELQQWKFFVSKQFISDIWFLCLLYVNDI